MTTAIVNQTLDVQKTSDESNDASKTQNNTSQAADTQKASIPEVAEPQSNTPALPVVIFESGAKLLCGLLSGKLIVLLMSIALIWKLTLEKLPRYSYGHMPLLKMIRILMSDKLFILSAASLTSKLYFVAGIAVIILEQLTRYGINFERCKVVIHTFMSVFSMLGGVLFTFMCFVQISSGMQLFLLAIGIALLFDFSFTVLQLFDWRRRKRDIQKHLLHARGSTPVFITPGNFIDKKPTA